MVAISLTDNLGTTYRSVGPDNLDVGIEAARSSAAWSETVFVPPVPEGALKLEATIRPRDAAVAFDLPRSASVAG